MSLSEETIKKRYGRLQPLEKVRKMVKDACDTSLIMQAVRTYGAQQYNQGCNDTNTRHRNRYNDMGQ